MLGMRKSISVNLKDLVALPEYYGDQMKRVMAGDVIIQVQEQGKKNNWVPHRCSLVSVDRGQRLQSANWGIFTSALPDGPAVVYRAPGGELRKPEALGCEVARTAQGWVEDDDYAKPTYRLYGEEPADLRTTFRSEKFRQIGTRQAEDVSRATEQARQRQLSGTVRAGLSARRLERAIPVVDTARRESHDRWISRTLATWPLGLCGKNTRPRGAGCGRRTDGPWRRRRGGRPSRCSRSGLPGEDVTRAGAGQGATTAWGLRLPVSRPHRAISAQLAVAEVSRLSSI